MLKWLHAVAIIIACSGSPVVSSRTQAVALEEIRQRATAYVVVYQQALTSLVATERYVQTLRRQRGGGQRRELVSEVVMVRGVAQTPRGRDLRGEGRLWVTDQGAIRRTELMLRDHASIGSATVDFRDDSAVGLRVPIKMTETYLLPGELIEGSATYSNFRRFTVQTSENLTKPPG